MSVTVPSGDWHRLSGGIMATVERNGDVVRRSTGSWTPAVHALLRCLHSVGFDRAPKVLGIDPQGRELLSFLPGDVPPARTWRGTDEAIVAAGRLLRRYHDATSAFRTGPDHHWDPFFRDPAAGSPADLRTGPTSELVICHNDFAVYNCVFVDGVPWGMIDFDSAAPGRRIWDLAGTAVGFVPFNPLIRLNDRPRRLRLLCDSYGLDDRSGFVDLIHERLGTIAVQLRALAGTDVAQAAVPPEAIEHCERTQRLIEAEHAALTEALR